jgi:hypothetical protein
VTYNDGYGREFPTQRLARWSERVELYPPKSRVDQDELILLEDVPFYSAGKNVFPCRCDLCFYIIENDDDDLFWHGYGNCVDLPASMLEEIEEFAQTVTAENPVDALAKIHGLSRLQWETDENLKLRIAQARQ